MRPFHSLTTFLSLALYLVSAPAATGAQATNTSSISTTNPFKGYEFFISPVYRAEVEAAAKTIKERGDRALAKQALTVARKVSTFLWVSDTATVPRISEWLSEADRIQRTTRKKQVVQIQIYNLPDRDCSAKASAGELVVADGGEEKYQKFILDIAKQLKKFPQIRVVLGLETDSIGNLVTNLSVEKCANAADAQKRSLAFGVANLQLPNVALYLDGAHAGWLGWPSNIGPTADIVAGILDAAKVLNPKSVIRGVATDVSNYNGLGNQPQTGYDELVYIKNLAPLLAEKGIDAHFIVDQGRSGNQNYTREGGDWCNNKYAGFGPLPSTNTPDPLVDAIVWVKPGGEGDGTSDTTSVRYDVSCSANSSHVPAPEAGTWFQAYFEQLLVNANPPIAPYH